jgi:hypothetical protein
LIEASDVGGVFQVEETDWVVCGRSELSGESGLATLAGAKKGNNGITFE